MFFSLFHRKLLNISSWEAMRWKKFPLRVVASARSSTFSLFQCLQDVYISTLGTCLHCVGVCSSSCAPFISEDILLFCVQRVEGAELKNNVHLLSWCRCSSRHAALQTGQAWWMKHTAWEISKQCSTAHLVSNCSCYVAQQFLRADSRSLSFCSSG